ncbi:MAG: Xaa-Pro peptidase family protein [Pseudomonadota bacterium]
MASDRLYFTANEYADRIQAIQKRMNDHGIEVLCMTAPENIFYATGYDGWSFYTHQMAIISLDQKEPIWIGREMDIACAVETTRMPEKDLIGYSDDYVDSTEKHAMEFIAQELTKRGWGSKKIGVESENYFFTARCAEKLTQSLPNATFIDATNLVNWVRLVKSPQEIQYMREAALLADAAMKAGIDAMEPGTRECDVAAAILAAQVKGVGDVFGDPATEILAMPVGQEVNCPHLAWTGRPLANSTPINLELGGVRRRYNSGISRSTHLGKAPDSLKSLASATLEALEVTLDAIKPGLLAEDVFHIYNGALEKYGQHKPSRTGYAIGIGYPPVWIERTVSFFPGDKTVLTENMTFHIMCGMWRDEDGFVESETFRLTDSGVEVFTQYPRGLTEKA